MLAANPVLMQNPACLGDFVKSLSSPSPSPSPAGAVTSPMEVDGEDKKGLAARKAFWSKYKRTSPPTDTATSQDGQEEIAKILAKPTLILGETIPDSPQTASPADPPAVEDPAVQLPETPKPEIPPPDIPKVAVPPVEPTPGVPKSGGECAVRRRVNKMDEVELASGLQKAREHPSFQHYLKAWGITADKFGVNMIDDMVAFTYFIEQTDSQPEGSTAQSPPEEPSPSAPSPQASEQPSNPTPPPAANQQHISEALTRLQTVDLDKGLRPPQSCVADPTVCHTVVLLSLAGKLQPVSVPMTPEQCVAAGLTLANPPHKDVNNHSEGTQLVALGSVGKDQEKNETKEMVEEKTEPKETDVKKDETDQDHDLDTRFPCT